MINSVEFEHLVGRVAQLIDRDEPPGLAAKQLARATLCLIKNREPKQALLIEKKMLDMDDEFPRES